MSLVFRAGWRHLHRFPGQMFLALAAIALGVAVVLGVNLANRSAERAFSLSAQAVAGRATDRIYGGPRGVPQAVYHTLRVGLGVRRAAPVVQGRLSVSGLTGGSVTLLGIDPFAEGPFRHYVGGHGGDIDPGRLITEPRSALVPAGLARRLGVRAGSTIHVGTPGGTASLHVIGLIPASAMGAAGAADELVVVDISTAQSLLGRSGWLSHIDLILPGEAARKRLRAELPAGVRLVNAASRDRALLQMTRAFRLNLTALSLLALVVGLFLIHNTMSFLVVQRRELVGTLRALGVDRRQIVGHILLEAVVLGVAGTCLGIVLGIPLAAVLLRLVTRTISDLYFHVQVNSLHLSPLALVEAGFLGVAGSVAAAFPPAREAARVMPRAAMSRADLEAAVRRRAGRGALIGVGAIVAGGLALALGGRGMAMGFAGLFLLILGAALFVPVLTGALARGVSPLLGKIFGTVGRLASGGVAASLSRTGVAVAALAVAVSVVIGMGTMIDSFRLSVSRWLSGTLNADLYLTGPEGPSSSTESLDDALASRIGKLPEVAEVDLSRRIRLPTRHGYIRLWALRAGPRRRAGFEFRAGSPAAAWRAFDGGAVLVSEPYAYRHRLTLGGRLDLPTTAGARAFRVAGVFTDYASDRGTVLMARRTYRRWFRDTTLTGMAVYGKSHADSAALRAALKRSLKGLDGVVLRDSRAVRERSLEIFDRTFAVTGVLRLLAGLVAFAGVFGALMALQLEQTWEHGVLRAIGFTRRQVVGLLTFQSALLGLAAGLLALPMGIGMAAMLVFVINRRAFGWSMAFHLSPAELAAGVGLALGAAVLAGIWPARRAALNLPARLLRRE